ncbi:MAG: AMP-binding protein, partial [Caulobacterales bacterium]
MTSMDEIDRDRAARRAYWRAQGVYADYAYSDAFRDAMAQEKIRKQRLLFHSRVRPRDTTVGELYDASANLAAAFHALGLRQGDAIAVMLPTWSETSLAYLAALRLGLVVIPIVAIYGGREIGFIVRQTGAKAIIIPDEWRGSDYSTRIEQAGEMPSLSHIISVGARNKASTVSWDDLINHCDAEYPAPVVNGDDLCLIIYTSGTTSDPKGVKHTHNTMLCDRNAVRASGVDVVVPFELDGPTLSVFPAGHIAGFLGMLRPFLAFQGDLITVDHWIPEDGARLIQEQKITSTTGTPVFLTTLLEAAEKIGADLSSLKRFNLGASAITPDNVRATDKMGFSGGRTYGMSEHTVVSSSTGDTFEKRAYTDGKITPRNQVRICDDDGRDVPTGQQGEVCTLGPRL